MKIPEMSDKTYNNLKFVALVVLPCIAAFWATISTIWGIPYGEQIVGTISAADALLGGILGVSSKQYNIKIASSKTSTE